LKEFMPAAAAGDLLSQRGLGWMYAHGDGVPQDFKLAFDWYQKSASQGDAYAQNRLGELFQFGHGVKLDLAAAASWYRKAAEQGSAEGQANIGWMYQVGQGVPRDDKTALLWFQKAAAQNSATAQNSLGVMYQYGQGVPIDLAASVGWYRKSAEQGNTVAQNNLGVMYQYGYGVAIDLAAAVDWYRKAAQLGDAPGQRNLGEMLQKGQGVTRDPVKAVEWFRKGAAAGDAGSQAYLGYMLELGEGVKQDYKLAAEWYRKSAAQGNVWAQRNLARMYEGGIGVPRDLKRAAELVAKADATEGVKTPPKAADGSASLDDRRAVFGLLVGGELPVIPACREGQEMPANQPYCVERDNSGNESLANLTDDHAEAYRAVGAIPLSIHINNDMFDTSLLYALPLLGTLPVLDVWVTRDKTIQVLHCGTRLSVVEPAIDLLTRKFGEPSGQDFTEWRNNQTGQLLGKTPNIRWNNSGYVVDYISQVSGMFGGPSPMGSITISAADFVRRVDAIERKNAPPPKKGM
jgi:TPR repeat protein